MVTPGETTKQLQSLLEEIDDAVIHEASAITSIRELTTTLSKDAEILGSVLPKLRCNCDDCLNSQREAAIETMQKEPHAASLYWIGYAVVKHKRMQAIQDRLADIGSGN